MYKIKGAKKTCTKTTRKGISQNIENVQKTSKTMKFLDVNDNEAVSEPKPIFRKNTKRLSKRRREEEITPQHEELVKYIHNSWLAHSTECEEQGTSSTSIDNNRTSLYYEEAPSPQLKEFKPFELELWWGKRLYNLITKSV